MDISLRELTEDDYKEVYALWQASEGIGLSASDQKDDIAAFLKRNPGLSFVAHDGDQLVGAALCGHDGRRGYIHHLAVRDSHQRQGLGKRITNHCLVALGEIGIDKCHLFVFNQNQVAIAFWEDIGWTRRGDLVVMSKFVNEAENETEAHVIDALGGLRNASS